MLNFEVDPAKLAAIRSQLGVRLPGEGTSEEPTSIKRKPGRPRKIVGPKHEPEILEATEPTLGYEPAPLITVDEKLLAKRLQGFFQGTTGIVGAASKEYLAMTDEEAEAIAVPLSSYLIRRAPDSEQIQQFIENYDLLAIVTGTATYVARVYHDRKLDVEQQRIARAQSARSPVNRASEGVTEEPSEFNGRPEDEIVSPLRSISGPIIRVDGQP